MNKTRGEVVSVTTTAKYVSVIGVEQIRDYRPPDAETAAKTKAAMKLPPICNYPGEGFLHLTKAELSTHLCQKWSDWPKVAYVAKTETTGRHRVRQTRKPGGEFYTSVPVYLTDQKRVDPPVLTPEPPEPTESDSEDEDFYVPDPEVTTLLDNEDPPEIPFEDSKLNGSEPLCTPVENPGADFEAMRASLRAGVQVVSAPQLFPTPAELARRMVNLARVEPGDAVLEPSAGTGAILNECLSLNLSGRTVAVERNHALAHRLGQKYPKLDVRCQDFLECNGDLGKFDVVLANPPFENAMDIKHIQHALTMLNHSGVLVAICSNGPRQNAILQPLADLWEVLPRGTFPGTNVAAVLLVIRR